MEGTSCTGRWLLPLTFPLTPRVHRFHPPAVQEPLGWREPISGAQRVRGGALPLLDTHLVSSKYPRGEKAECPPGLLCFSGGGGPAVHWDGLWLSPLDVGRWGPTLSPTLWPALLCAPPLHTSVMGLGCPPAVSFPPASLQDPSQAF